MSVVDAGTVLKSRSATKEVLERIPIEAGALDDVIQSGLCGCQVAKVGLTHNCKLTNRF